MEKPGTWIAIKGSSKRFKSTVMHYKYVRDIPIEFQDRMYKGIDNCVWLAASIAVYFVNQNDAHYILKVMKKDLQIYHYLNI